jgi:hypothetical protein
MRKRKPPPVKNCDVCGRTFKARQPKEKFCSGGCRYKALHPRREVKNCAACGRFFCSSIPKARCCPGHSRAEARLLPSDDTSGKNQVLWWRTEAGKEYRRRYQRTEKFREYRRRYLQKRAAAASES